MMKIKIKKNLKSGVSRQETLGEIKEILINQDFTKPSDEVIQVCWRGADATGIVELTPGEVDQLTKTLRGRLQLVKGFKIFRGRGI
jgi:hypothetical protein